MSPWYSSNRPACLVLATAASDGIDTDAVFKVSPRLIEQEAVSTADFQQRSSSQPTPLQLAQEAAKGSRRADSC